MGDLRDSEDEHEVVEELQGRSPLARPIHSSSPYMPHDSSLTALGTSCPRNLKTVTERRPLLPPFCTRSPQVSICRPNDAVSMSKVAGMKLSRFDLYRYSLPFSRPLKLGGATLNHREGLLLRLAGDDGS